MPIPPERKSVVSSGDEKVPEKPSREPLKKYSPENEQNLPKVSFFTNLTTKFRRFTEF